MHGMESNTERIEALRNTRCITSLDINTSNTTRGQNKAERGKNVDKEDEGVKKASEFDVLNACMVKILG